MRSSNSSFARVARPTRIWNSGRGRFFGRTRSKRMSRPPPGTMRGRLSGCGCGTPVASSSTGASARLALGATASRTVATTRASPNAVDLSPPRRLLGTCFALDASVRREPSGTVPSRPFRASRARRTRRSLAPGGSRSGCTSRGHEGRLVESRLAASGVRIATPALNVAVAERFVWSRASKESRLSTISKKRASSGSGSG